ncbi:MAG: hypothetical protein WBA61_03065 [Aequorivita sp.]
MAKQTGIIRLKGTLDGINFYGKDNARTAGGGYNTKAIKTKPSMARTRENASEFGHGSRVKRAFRTSLAPFLCIRKDGTLHGRMMQLFPKLIMLDRVNSRGERRVAPGLETPRGRQLLRDFVLSPACEVFEVLGTSGVFDFPSRILEVADFDIKDVRFPSGATHLALTLGLLHFDFASLEYKLNTSAPLYMDKSYAGTSFNLNVDLPEIPGTAIAVLGIKFYQEVAGTYYLFRDAKAVGVDIIGVDGP